jgi:hypothetical protein
MRTAFPAMLRILVNPVGHIASSMSGALSVGVVVVVVCVAIAL